LVLRPDDLSGLQYNPIALGSYFGSQDVFWSQDKPLTTLTPIPLETKKYTVNWAKARSKLPPALAQGESFATLLSLLMDLHKQADRCVLLNKSDSTGVWTLMGYLLSLLPQFMRAYVSLANVSIGSCVKAATAQPSLAAMPIDVSTAGNYRLSNMAAEVDMSTGQIHLAAPGYSPRKLAQWVAGHLDSSASTFYTQGEKAVLGSLEEYERLGEFFALFDRPVEKPVVVSPSTPETADPASGSPAAAPQQQGGEVQNALKGLFSLVDAFGARRPWIRTMLSDLLQARFALEDHVCVASILRFIAGRNLSAPPTGKAAAIEKDATDFLGRLENGILNSLRLGNWCMAQALLEGFNLGQRSDVLLKASQQAGASIRPPQSSDSEQMKAFSSVVRSVYADLVRLPPADQFCVITDLLFRLLESPNAGEYKNIIVFIMDNCLRLMKTHGVSELDGARVQQLCDSPLLDLSPELSLLCVRLKFRRVSQASATEQDEASRSNTARSVGNLMDTLAGNLRNSDRPEAGLKSIIDTDIAALADSPPYKSLALGVLWAGAPEPCRAAIFERFCREPVLRAADMTSAGNQTQSAPVGSGVDVILGEDVSPLRVVSQHVPEAGPQGRDWLLGQLVDQGKPEVMIRWAMESTDPEVARWFNSFLNTCADPQKLVILNAISLVLPVNPSKQTGYRNVVFALANDPGVYSYSPQVQTGLAKAVVQLARPGDKLPMLLNSGDCQAAMSPSDQKYMQLLGIVQDAETRPASSTLGQWYWLRVWIGLQAKHTLADQQIPKEWAAGPRGAALANWVLQGLGKHRVAGNVEMNVVEQLLRTLCVYTEQRWSDALGRAIASYRGSWIDQAALAVWACRSYAGLPLWEGRAPLPLQYMLSQADSFTLRQIEAANEPIEGIPAELLGSLIQTARQLLGSRTNRPVSQAAQPQRQGIRGLFSRGRSRSKDSGTEGVVEGNAGDDEDNVTHDNSSPPNGG
jgi:hypothetical protein